MHASDTPCLPSRSALSSGQFGIRNGSINHGGPSTDPFPEGRDRQFQTSLARNGWMSALRSQGLWTASISTFAERHSAYHFEAGFNECFNLGTRGMETAEQVAAVARDWLARNGQRRTGSSMSTSGTPTPPTGRPPRSATPSMTVGSRRG